ncbi:hypothetical protein SAMN05444483_102229 [Salegentibacter echinorum]|uniref:Uncharacterized protein n=1 Tax=Salegentibacter echinorum TaxID=1073325 RepID=A0A1M5E4M7_SALEC|nr:hypothetical protein SAMN05444483_102229 [Salegentibacter echinorum]
MLYKLRVNLGRGSRETDNTSEYYKIFRVNRFKKWKIDIESNETNLYFLLKEHLV